MAMNATFKFYNHGKLLRMAKKAARSVYSPLHKRMEKCVYHSVVLLDLIIECLAEYFSGRLAYILHLSSALYCNMNYYLPDIFSSSGGKIFKNNLYTLLRIRSSYEHYCTLKNIFNFIYSVI